MTTPTDLEIVTACAKAMEIPTGAYGSSTLHESTGGYWPLTNKRQAFDLVERFWMVVEREVNGMFGVTCWESGYKSAAQVVRNEPDLRRAICLAVFRMQEAKNAGK